MIRNRYNYLTPSVLRYQRERRVHLKQRHHNKTLQAESQKGSFVPPKKITKRLSKIKIHQDIYANTYNDRYSKQQQKHYLGTASKMLLGVCVLGGLNRFYVATTIALSSAFVCTRHLFSPREEFLTHQCNISENIKIHRIQISNAVCILPG